MKEFWHSSIFAWLFDIAVICFCTAGIHLIHLKANLPVSTTTVDSFLVIEKLSSEADGFSRGQKIVSLDGFAFNSWEEMELYLDGKRIGEKVNVVVDNNAKPLEAVLTSYYSLFDILIISIVGLFFIFFAMLVRLKAPDNKSAKLFRLASLGLGMVITMTAGNYTNGLFGYGHFNRILWIAAYSVTPVLFIHFAFSFVKGGQKRKDWITGILYSVAAIHIVFLSYFFLEASLDKSIAGIKNYVSYYDTVFRIFQTLCIVAAITICVYAYINATALEERKRLQWLLLGFFIGPFSFVIFWILPIIFTGHSLLPESLAIFFLIAIPVTFSIAIVKYHLMDIQLLIRRSIVYSTILAAILITYIGLSFLITLFVSDINPVFPSMLTAVAVVLALQPVKNAIQKFVDKRFFRIEYDFREEQKKFLDDIKNSLDIKSLANKIVSQTNSLIPVDNIGFFILNKSDNRIKMIANKGWDLLKRRSLRFEAENLKTDLSLPVAMDGKIEPGLDIESADVNVFRRWGMVLVFPVKSPSGVIHAFLVLGDKLSKERYLKDDIDLLNTVTTAAALAIDKIKMQEDLVREKLEAERLEELNKMKSFFLQSITHDLKNPLTSIKMYVELLQMELNQSGEKTMKHLSIIDGESDRLRRLIDNILDAGKIEKGIKTYKFEIIKLNDIVCNVLKEIQHQADMKKQKVIFDNSPTQFFINGDPDAVERAIINILSNSIKYSDEYTSICISILNQNGFTGVVVKDSGRGITKIQLQKIFEPYYRSENEVELKEKGTGLGLAIVNHIMDAHNGKVEAESEPGKGSIFSLWFPELRNE